MCAENARKQRDEALGSVEEESQRYISLLGESMRRFCVRARETTSLRTADMELELAQVRAFQADIAQQVETRVDEVRRTAEQRDRVAEEFATLKETVEHYRESETLQEASLAAEVRALEDASEARLGDAEAALAAEMEALRAASAFEAEVRFRARRGRFFWLTCVGSCARKCLTPPPPPPTHTQRLATSMLERFHQETEEAIASLRGAAELRFKEIVEAPSHQVSDEFEEIMQSLETKRRANVALGAQLREQLQAVSAQLAAIGRAGAGAERAASAKHAAYLASASNPARAAADLELLRLKQAVRGIWRGSAASAAAGNPVPGASVTDKVIFLSRALKLTTYSPRVYAALLAHARALRASSERNLSSERAVDSARAAYRATAQRMAAAAQQLAGRV